MRGAIKITPDITNGQLGVCKHLLDAFSGVELDGFVHGPFASVGDNADLLLDAAVVSDSAVLLNGSGAVGVLTVGLEGVTKVGFINIVEPEDSAGLEGFGGLGNNSEVFPVGLKVAKGSEQ